MGPDEPWDCFTRINLDSINQTLRNASSKSVILAPFNSSMSDMESFFKDVNSAPMEDRKEVIKFAARCRDQNRQYEINNNADLDNGVYHKFVYSSKDAGSDKNRTNEEPMLSRNSSKANLPQESRGKQVSTFQRERESLKAELKRGLRKSPVESIGNETDEETKSLPYLVQE